MISGASPVEGARCANSWSELSRILEIRLCQFATPSPPAYHRHSCQLETGGEGNARAWCSADSPNLSQCVLCEEAQTTQRVETRHSSCVPIRGLPSYHNHASKYVELELWFVCQHNYNPDHRQLGGHRTRHVQSGFVTFPRGSAISYRWSFVGALAEGESIAYGWTGKDKVRIKLLQNPKQRECTVPVSKIFDWTQVKPNLVAGGFIKLGAFCGPETAFGKVRANLLSSANQKRPVARKASVEQSTSDEAKAPSTLTNKEVSGMIASGLSPDVVIAKMESSPCNFDTSPQALEDLKQSSVPNSVILVMVKRSESK